MKNIKIYEAEKYSTWMYEKVEDGIYKVCQKNKETEKPLDPEELTAEEVFLDNAWYHRLDAEEMPEGLMTEAVWKRFSETDEDGEELDHMYVTVYQGRAYYKDSYGYINISFEDYHDMYPTYVISLAYEDEPYLEEEEINFNYTDRLLQALADEFDCAVGEYYLEVSDADPIYSYVEYESGYIEDLRRIRDEVIGKHIYFDDDAKLVIE